jgi:hypothetical protein
LSQGDLQSALYDGLDFVVYTNLVKAGAVTTPEAGGVSAEEAAAAAVAYYIAGGSRGLIQSAACAQSDTH